MRIEEYTAKFEKDRGSICIGDCVFTKSEWPVIRKWAEENHIIIALDESMLFKDGDWAAVLMSNSQQAEKRLGRLGRGWSHKGAIRAITPFFDSKYSENMIPNFRALVPELAKTAVDGT